MKGQCIPRMMKNNSCPKNRSSPASPIMTLSERFRAAVLRLMMLSALSKAADHGGNRGQTHRCYQLNEHNHHSEAVADCIEFIKQKAVAVAVDRPKSSIY
ncbi:hypothetical protein K1719_007111 [Acacia pycnantha]|nr:hypothetical protein K1719_007111 [Acacia pycnantha]